MLPYYEATDKDFHINWWKQSRDWPLHLQSQLELIYVREGCVEVTIDSQTRVMEAGDFAVAFPNCIHGYQKVPDRDACDIWYFIVNPHMAGDYADRIHAYVPRTPFLLGKDLPEDAQVALDRLRGQREKYHPSVAKSYIQIVLASVWPQLHPEQEETRHRALPYLALQYVTEHYQQPITLESMARELGVSKNHLSRVFSQKLHMRFPQYLNFLRMEMARDLLRKTDHSIITILYECGYESPRTFNRVFQELCGVSPREYRRQFQNM